MRWRATIGCGATFARFWAASPTFRPRGLAPPIRPRTNVGAGQHATTGTPDSRFWPSWIRPTILGTSAASAPIP